MGVAVLDFDNDFLRAEAPARAPAPLVAALDVGVSKTVCLAARHDPVLDFHPGRPMRVSGVGVQTAPAVASGKAADFDGCARAIRVAMDEAAFMAGAPIRRVTATYSGPGLNAAIVHGGVRVRGKIIGHREIEAAIAAALQTQPKSDRTILHAEPLRFFIDDGAPVDDPTGHSGRTLQVEVCAVSAPSQAISALKACVRQAGAEVDEIVPGPSAAGFAALTRDEREAGALVLDIGAGAIGMAVFAEEGLVHAETVSVGGVRLTRDLAAKLRTSYAAAERVKLAFGAVNGAYDPREAIAAPRLGPDGRLEAATTLRGVIADTLAPRLMEMLLLARQQLARAGFSGGDGPQRAVLVGGGAMIPGLRELAVEALGMPVRIGRPDVSGFDHGEAGPAYAAASGALRWRLDIPAPEDDDEGQPTLGDLIGAVRNGVSKAWRWLRDNF